jgi:atypical dual specificity phosphatase
MSRDFSEEKKILPEFPRTPHIPHKVNGDDSDLITGHEEFFEAMKSRACIEEKIDGASCGMALFEDHPLIRNRDHILRKGYFKKGSAAKEQFGSVFSWFYEHKGQFLKLKECGPYSVYGEWCVARHGIFYNRLPQWFIAYDIYDHDQKVWLQSDLTRAVLTVCGFSMPHLFESGYCFRTTYDQLELWANEQSRWSLEKGEGIYVKIYDDKQVTARYKMVRESFVRGAYWNPKVVTKNVCLNEEITCPPN